MALVASDHQAGMPVPIRNLNVSATLHQVAHDLDVSVEAGGAQRRAIRLGRAVHVGALAHQVLDNFEVARGAGAPERRRALDVLALEVDEARLLQAGATPVINEKLMENNMQN